MLLALCAGCLGPVKGLYPPPQGQPTKTIYVIHRGLHAGVIVRTRDIPAGVWPEHAAFPQAEYLETGWGDTEGYRYALTTPIVLRALFFSKGSVLLIHDFSGSITNEYKEVAREIIEVRVSERGFRRLCIFIQETYHLDPHGHPIRLRSEARGQGFYEANGHYSALKNCNNWTTRVLRTAGCPVTPRCSLLPKLVMLQSRRFGQRIWPPRPKRQETPSAP